MGVFIERLKSVLSSLRQDSSQKKDSVGVSAFWAVLEEWTDTIPNSKEELACIEKIKVTSVFRRELLLAYQMIQEDTPLKEVLFARISRCPGISPDEWIEVAELTLMMGSIRRRR